MQQEDGKSGDGNPGSSSPLNYEDDELIDMEMDDCPSDEENFNSSHWLNTFKLKYTCNDALLKHFKHFQHTFRTSQA